MTYPTSALALLLAITGCNSPTDDPAPLPPAAAARTQTGQGPAVPAAVPPTKRAAKTLAAADQPRLAIDPDGLRWFLPSNGSARPLPFGAAQTEVLASLEGGRGEAAQGTNRDCGAGPVQYATWGDGLSLAFQKGRFAGWGLDSRARGAIATADGIGIGTTRAQMSDAIGTPVDIRQTSLGTEFSAGEYHGLLGGTGPGSRITDMWAGVSCVAR